MKKDVKLLEKGIFTYSFHSFQNENYYLGYIGFSIL